MKRGSYDFVSLPTDYERELHRIQQRRTLAFRLQIAAVIAVLAALIIHTNQ